MLKNIFYQRGYNATCPRTLCELVMLNNRWVRTEDHDDVIWPLLSWPCTEYDVWFLVDAFYKLKPTECLNDAIKRQNRDTVVWNAPVKAVTPMGLARALICHANAEKQNSDKRLDAKSVLGKKMARVWSSRLPWVISRPATSCKHPLKNRGVHVSATKSKTSVVPYPRSFVDPACVKASLRYIANSIEDAKITQMLLADARRDSTQISFVHIPDVEMCQTKCVPPKHVDRFASSLFIVMCRECMGRSSNFSSDKKTGWFLDGYSGVQGCVRCGTRENGFRVFGLVDCRVGRGSNNFVCNFYAFFPRPTKTSALLKPTWDSHISPCMASRTCYGYVTNRGPTNFKSAKCGKCANYAEVTCEDKCVSSGNGGVSGDNDNDLQTYLSASCTGCIISMLCCCQKCRHTKRFCRQALISKWNTQQTCNKWRRKVSN